MYDVVIYTCIQRLESSIMLTMHNALIVIYKSACSKGARLSLGGQMLPLVPLKEALHVHKED